VVPSRPSAAPKVVQPACVPENESRRSSRGEDKGEEEQEEEQREEWRANEVYESNHRHSKYLNRKRRAPRTDLSKRTAEEQTRYKRAKAR